MDLAAQLCYSPKVVLKHAAQAAEADQRYAAVLPAIIRSTRPPDPPPPTSHSVTRVLELRYASAELPQSAHSGSNPACSCNLEFRSQPQARRSVPHLLDPPHGLVPRASGFRVSTTRQTAVPWRDSEPARFQRRFYSLYGRLCAIDR